MDNKQQGVKIYLGGWAPFRFLFTYPFFRFQPYLEIPHFQFIVTCDRKIQSNYIEYGNRYWKILNRYHKYFFSTSWVDVNWLAGVKCRTQRVQSSRLFYLIYFLYFLLLLWITIKTGGDGYWEKVACKQAFTVNFEIGRSAQVEEALWK